MFRYTVSKLSLYSKRMPSCYSTNIPNIDDMRTLRNIQEPEKMKCISFEGYSFWGIPTNIYDGDTLSIIFMHDGKPIKYRCQTLGYDSPEMKPLLVNPKRKTEIMLAIKARDRFATLLTMHDTKMVFVRCHKFDKYGRLLVELWNDVDGESINKIMIKEGHGKPYDGGKKPLWV